MSDTVKRFEAGVHTKGNCGKNKHGYAAMNAVFQSADLHKLGTVLTSSFKSPSTIPKKKTFAYSDILAYIFMKVLLCKGTDNVYILFLSSGSFMSSTIKNMISSMSRMMNLLITVQCNENEFLVTMNFGGVESSHGYTTEDDLLKFFSLLEGTEDMFAIVHPVVDPVYKSIISKCGIQYWCVPSSRSEIYISESTTGTYFHNVFPWSRCPCYSGFTIGSGQMKLGSVVDRSRYVGAFNSYEMLVSSTPIGNSCVDCIALKQTGDFIQLLIGKTKTKHRHTLSSSSIEALEEVQRMIADSIQQS
jgi:hypothetical protein